MARAIARAEDFSAWLGLFRDLFLSAPKKTQLKIFVFLIFTVFSKDLLFSSQNNCFSGSEVHKTRLGVSSNNWTVKIL